MFEQNFQFTPPPDPSPAKLERGRVGIRHWFACRAWLKFTSPPAPSPSDGEGEIKTERVRSPYTERGIKRELIVL